jgi:hypothetical protein
VLVSNKLPKRELVWALSIVERKFGLVGAENPQVLVALVGFGVQ